MNAIVPYVNYWHRYSRASGGRTYSGSRWPCVTKVTPYRDCMKIMTPNGFAGDMGYASAAATADFIIPNMVAEAGSGSKTPKEAAERAQKRAERYYKV